MPKTIKKLKKQIKKTGKSILRNSGLTRQLKSAGISDAYIAKNNCPPLTAQEKSEIDAFWAEYGVKILNYDYHRMFYHVTGIHDPRFIPDSISHRVCVPYYNNPEKMRTYVDKNMFQRYLPEMPFPKMFGQCVNGHFCGPDGEYISDEITDEYLDIVYNAFHENDNDSLIIKQAMGSYCGKGVRKYTIASREELRNAIEENNSGNFLIQTAIKQHAFFRQFNESSVNIIRCTTWRHGKNVYFFCPCVRYGIEGSPTDVAFVDGEEIVQVVGIGEDGRIYDKGFTMSGNRLDPVVEDKQVPYWDKIKETVTRGHLQLHYFDLVGWDITLDEDGNVVCIEYNLIHPGSIIYQFAHGPLAGDQTDAFLSFLKDPANREKYLPAAARL